MAEVKFGELRSVVEAVRQIVLDWDGFVSNVEAMAREHDEYRQTPIAWAWDFGGSAPPTSDAPGCRGDAGRAASPGQPRRAVARTGPPGSGARGIAAHSVTLRVATRRSSGSASVSSASSATCRSATRR
jgi:hypothetical protein